MQLSKTPREYETGVQMKSLTSYGCLKDHPRTTQRGCSTLCELWAGFISAQRVFFFIFFAFFFLVSMAPQRSSQWNLLPPLWSCNTRSVMSQSSKYIAVIRMHPLMGFEMVFNWTPPRWCVRRSRKEKKKQKTLNRIQIAFKARGQIFAPENKSRIFAPHKSSRAAPGRFFPSDQLWILTRSFFFLVCSSRRSLSRTPFNFTRDV